MKRKIYLVHPVDHPCCVIIILEEELIYQPKLLLKPIIIKWLLPWIFLFSSTLARSILRHWQFILTTEYIRGCPRFKFMDLILRRSTKGCQGVTLSTFCKDFFNKVSDKLLGPYTSLVQAVLSSAAGRTRSCPRSLSPTLLKKNSSGLFGWLFGILLHCHPSPFWAPSIILALAHLALKFWSDWFSSELIHCTFGPNTALSQIIVSFLVICARRWKNAILWNFVRAKKSCLNVIFGPPIGYYG